MVRAVKPARILQALVNAVVLALFIAQLGKTASAQKEVYSNLASAALASGISSGATSLTVATGEGAEFPSISGSDYFWAVLSEGSTTEIVKVTARSSDTLTIVRAQQGTSASAFTTAATVSQRLTKSTLEALRDLTAGFFNISGPTAARTYTFPDASTSIPGYTGSVSNGTTICYDGSAWVAVAPGAIGTFLRINTTATPACEWASAPNVSDQDADATNSSNTTPTELTNMAAAPAADTWVKYDCTIWFQSAATTTGILAGIWANNAGATAAPQFFSARYEMGGQGASSPAGTGTDETVVQYTTSHGTLTLGTTGVVSTSVWYLLKIDSLILTHATDAGFLIWPRVRSEVNSSTITIKEGSQCSATILHVDS
jgi:hypothetical protein